MADKNIEKRLKEAEAIGKKLGVGADKIANVQQDILDKNLNTLKAVRDRLAAEERIAAAKERQASLEESILNLSGKLLDGTKFIAEYTKEGAAAINDQSKLLRKQITIEMKRNKSFQSTGQEALKILDHTKEMSKLAAQINSRSDIAAAFREANDAADSLQSGIDSFMNSFPGGGILSAALGLDNIGAQIKGAFIKNMMAAGTAGTTVFGTLGAAVRAFTAVLMANPIIAIAAAALALLATIKALVGLAIKFEKHARETAEATGSNVIAMKQLVKEAKAVSAFGGLQLAQSKDILAIQKQVGQEMGTMFALSADTAGNIAETAQAFSIGIERAGEFSSALLGVGVDGDQALSMLEEVGAELMGTGFAAGPVIEDMAKNAGLIGSHFKGNVKEFKKAAVQAAKMGLSLSKMEKVADGLLDIESSLTSQMELQVLSGRQFNFDKARSLAIDGDILGASQAVLDQVGGIHDLNEMDYYTKQKLAEASGMEISDLYRAAKLKEMGGMFAEEELKMLEKQGITVDQLHKMDKDARIQAQKDAQAGLATEKSLADLKEQAMEALLPLGQVFLDLMEDLMPTVQSIASALKPVGKILSFAVKMATRLISPFANILSTIFGIFDGTSSFRDLIKAVGDYLYAFFIAPFEYIYDLLADLFDWPGSFGEAMSSVFNAVLDVVKAPFNLLIKGINYVIGGLNKINFSIPSWVPFIGGKSFGFSLPEVPYLEEGGSVGETGLAVVHKGEVVLPEAQKLPQFDLQPLGESLQAINVKTIPLMMQLPMILPALTAAMTAAVIAGNTATAIIPRPVLIMNPVIPTFETNPVITAAAALEVATQGLRALFGSRNNDTERIVNGLDEVVHAIENINIEMDGEKVGFLTKVRDTFRRKF